MSISAAQVKELRDQTGAGMMECKKALMEHQGDVDKAIDHLRKQGALKAAKRSDRITSEGLVAEAVSEDEKRAALTELDFETDFVARTDQFQGFVRALALHVLKTNPRSMDDLLSGKFHVQPQHTVQEALTELVRKTGENISIKRFVCLAAPSQGEQLSVYVHPGNKIGVLVKVFGQKSKVDKQAIRDIAMHIAAMNPLYLSADQVPREVEERERNVIRSSADIQGKPEKVVENIIEGRYRKFLAEVCLLNQIFIKDPQGKLSVEKVLKTIDSEMQITEFARFQVGESNS